jgi:hypothetical protein
MAHAVNSTPDPCWWTPFCLVVDWVAAAIPVVLIAVGVDFHH